MSAETFDYILLAVALAGLIGCWIARLREEEIEKQVRDGKRDFTRNL